MRDLCARSVALPEGADALLNKVNWLYECVSKDACQKICLAHNDVLGANVLVDVAGCYHLIDWEYAGMSDYAQDLGTLCVSDELNEQEFDAVLVEYFGRNPTCDERRHCIAYVGFAGWCWYLWSLVKEAEGEPVGDCRYLYYRYAKRYVERASSEYGAGFAGSVAKV